MKKTGSIFAHLFGVVVISALLLVAGANAAHAQSSPIEEFDNTLTAFNEVSYPCATPLIYRLTFFDDFTINSVEFEFVATHTYRGDVRVTLISPAGTQALVIATPGDAADNFNLRLSDSAANPINNFANDDPDSPTRRLVRPTNPLSPFIGQNAQGVWQVQICDAANQDSGEHRLSLLRLFGVARESTRATGYWPLDEASGATTADLAPFNLLGTLRNGPARTAATTPAIPFVNPNAMTFDGLDDFVEVAFPTSSWRSFTVAFWAKREAINRSDWIFGRGTPQTNIGLQIGFRANNTFSCAFWNNDLNTAAFTDTDWHHWTCTYDSITNQRTIYRDGVLVAQDTAASDYLGRTGNFFFGRLLIGSEYFRGSLDEVRLYPSALARGEVVTLAQGTNTTCQARLPDGRIFTSSGRNLFPLQDAVDSAAIGETIKVAGACTGVQRRGGQLQALFLNKNLTLEGGYDGTDWDTPDPRANATTLDAQGLGRVVFVPAGVTAVLANLTLTGGRAPDGAAGANGTDSTGAPGSPGGAGGDGGGIYNLGTLAIRSSTLRNNTAGGGGAGGNGGTGGNGGIGSSGFGGDPGGFGGNGGAGAPGGAGGRGGAIFSQGALVIEGVAVAGNSSGAGGAGGVGGGGGIGGSGGTGSLGTGGRGGDGGRGGSGGSGGAAGAGSAIVAAGGTLSIRNSTITGNAMGSGGAGRAGGVGGRGGNGGNGFFAGGNGGNGGPGGNGANGGVAGSGGIHSLNATTVVNHSTVSGNGGGAVGPAGGASNGGAGGFGGFSGLGVSAGAGAGAPGGIGGAAGAAGAGRGLTRTGAGALSVFNTIVANNAGGNCSGSITANQFSLASDNTCGSALVVADAKLGALADNGGPTQTLFPQADSPALDAGDPAFAEPDAVDQRGRSRVGNGRSDIGAVEINPVCFATPNDGVSVFKSETSQAVQKAADHLPASGGLVKVAGTCVGTEARAGLRQLAMITGTVALQGGWDSTFAAHDPASQATVLDAGGSGRVLYVGANGKLSAMDLTLTGGDASGQGGHTATGGDAGGGVYVAAGVTVELVNTQVMRNTAPAYGGGIYNAGLLSMTESAVLSNTAAARPATTHLPLDESAGATVFVDSSGNGHNGSCAGATCPTAGASGQAGAALTFDGLDDAVDIAPAETLGLRNQDFTVVAWVNASALGGGDRAILGTSATVLNNGLHLIIRNGRPYMGFFNNDTSTTTPLNLNTWYHLAFRYNRASGQQAIFVDGVLGNATNGHAPFQGTGTVRIGRWAGGNHFAGLIDDMRIYDRALSVEEIQGLVGGAVHRDGGGIYSAGVMTLTHATLAGNSADRGGALYLERVGDPAFTLEQSSIYANQARLGAGLYLADGKVSAFNTTLSANVADAGGGIFAVLGELDLRFLTMANNEATDVTQGASFHNEGAVVKLLATVVAGPASAPNCTGLPLTSNGGYNRISDLSCALANAVSAAEGLDRQNVANLPLGPLTDNGGPNLTHKPAPDAVLVDVMSGFVCGQLFTDREQVDQRGRLRPSLGIRVEGVFTPPADWRCDVGAVELGSENHRVCGAPLLLGYSGGNPQFSDNLRCDTDTIDKALDRAQTGDTVIVTGIVTETVIVDKSVIIRGPLPEEITPGTHMGFVQGALLPPTSGSADNGGIFQILGGREVTIEELNLRHGSAVTGGAISNAGTLVLKGVTLDHNRAISGAAVYNMGSLEVINSTLVDNEANLGGVLHNAPGATLSVVHATVADNTGAPIHNQNNSAGSASVAATILSNGGAASQCVGPMTAGNGNVTHNANCLAGAFNGDPLLGPLRDNGGPTLTRALPANSPAVNRALCTVDSDQRGRNRPTGATCDTGAFELAPLTLRVCINCEADAAARRYTSLQAALNAAMAGDTIAIEAGAYTGNFLLYKDVTLQHAGIDVNTLSREQAVDVRAILQASTRTLREQQRLQEPGGSVLMIQSYTPLPASGTIVPGDDLKVVLRGLTVRRGMSMLGGGIFNRGALEIYASTIEGNVAANGWDDPELGVVSLGEEAKGAAIYSMGSLLLMRSTLSGNQSEFYGGAVYAEGRGVDNRANVLIEASTVAENRAERLSRQHVMVIDNDILNTGEARFIRPLTQTLSGDEILFQNKLPFQINLIVNNSGCNRANVILPPAALTTSPLICSAAGADRTVTIRADGLDNVQATFSVRALSFTPKGQAIFAADHSDITALSTIVANSNGSGFNCAGSANGNLWTIRSGNHNLVSDTSCGFNEIDDLRPAPGQILAAQLGSLQDNNLIDFQARSISGYAHTHALLPNSPAIDHIEANVCKANEQKSVNLASGNPNLTVAAGDTVQWQHNVRSTVVLNDGYANARLVPLVGSGAAFQSAAVQFAEPGVYRYRVYGDTNRQGGSTGAITVTPRQRATDQRGVALPQRGAQNRYFCDVGAYEFQTWIVGQPVPRSPSAIGTLAPRWALGDTQLDTENPPYHTWSAATAEDFPLRPSPNDGDLTLEPDEIVSVSWKTSAEPTSQETLKLVGVVEWPDEPQLHVSGAPVNISHSAVGDDFLVTAARAFEGRVPADDAAGAILNSNVFNRTELLNEQGDSYSVLLLARGNQSNPTLKVEVVKTIDWNLAGVRDVRNSATVCTIGTILDYQFDDAAGALVRHDDPQGLAGYILSGIAYDGVATAAEQPVRQNTVDGQVPPVHVRATRDGAIIPILNTAPTFADAQVITGGHDLRVAWYRTDSRNVAWPLKTVGYRCLWPTDPPKIIIASELGSEIANQVVLSSDRYLNPTVYHQPDTTLPGYNPNDEHALLASSNLGNSAPALYALRTDLAAESYALLKYRDGSENGKPKVGVYRVLLTQAAQAISNVSTTGGTVTLLPNQTRATLAGESIRAAAAAPPLTLRVGSGALPAGGQVVVPVEALGVRNLHATTLRVTYDPNVLQPTRCTTNRQDFVEAPSGLQVQTDSPVRPLNVIHMQAIIAAGTDMQFRWEFGDGSTRIAGPNVSHVYGAVGTYLVTVTASTGGFPAVAATTQVQVVDGAIPGRLAPAAATGCRIVTSGGTTALELKLRARNKHGVSGSLLLSEVTFRAAGSPPAAETPTQLGLVAQSVLGPSYESLQYDITAGNPVFAPTPVRTLLDVQPCQQTKAADLTAKPFWKDFKGALWARAAGQMQVLYYYPLQPGFHLTAAQAAAVGLDGLTEAQRVGQCVPWLHAENAATTLPDGSVRVYPVTYQVSWPPLPALLTVGETVYERSKNGISGVATQLAVSKIYDDEAPGVWNDVQQKITVSGPQAVRSVAELIDPMAPVQVPLGITFDGNHSLPITIKSERLLFGGGRSVIGTTDYEVTLPFALRSRIVFNDLTGDLIFKGYYDGASPQYIKGDPLLLLNVMSAADRTRLRSLCVDEQGNLRPGTEPARGQCSKFLTGVDALYHKSRNPRQLDLCRMADGRLFPGDTKPAFNQGAAAVFVAQASCPANTVRDGVPDNALLIDVQDLNNDGIPEPFEGLGKGKALTAGNADGTGYVTLAYNNDISLGGLPVSLQVIQVGCTLDAEGNDSTYRGNLLVLESDNLFDEKLTLRHTGDFGGQPDNFEFDWYIAEVDETAVSPSVLPPAYPWRQWTKLEPGAIKLEGEITLEGANPTTLSDNWFIMRYKGYQACGNQYRYSAFAGDPSAKPSELRAQFAPGWIKRVTSGLNPFDARVDDFVSAPVNSTVDMVRQAGKRYEGPVAMSNDPEVLNGMGLIEGYQTVLERGRSLSIDSNINHQGANAALLNVTSRIAGLYMLLANDAYADALDPTVALGTNSVVGFRAPALFAFMNQFRPDSFGPIDEELALLRGRDETLGGVAAAPTYNRLTWNFTNGEGEVADVQNYNVKDYNQDGFVDEADAALMVPQGHGDAWGHYLTALKSYYRLLRHPSFTWVPRAEPIGVAGAPVVVDYYDEQRFATAAAAKARMGVEIVNLTYRKHYADPENVPLIDAYIDPSDDTRRAWGTVDWARRAGQGAYLDWLVANAMLPAEDDRYTDVRKIDRSTVEALGEITDQYTAIQKQLDDADNGVNPLGLLGNAMLFDLDPALSAGGVTHFEQIYLRATSALNNTRLLFDYANDMKIAQRNAQNEQWDFTQSIIDQDRALIADLIELFGYPYDADIGVNGTYPAGYFGPDIYNYDLWDRIELTDHQKRCSTAAANNPALCPPETKTTLIEYRALPCVGLFVLYVNTSNPCPKANVTVTKTIEYVHGIGLDAGRGRFKPAAWPVSSSRRAPGDIQNAIQALNQARIEYESAILGYQDGVAQLEEFRNAYDARVEYVKSKRGLLVGEKATSIALGAAVLAAKIVANSMDTYGNTVTDFADDASDCVPDVLGFSNSIGAPPKCALRIAGSTLGAVAKGVKFGAEITIDVLEYANETVQNSIAIADFDTDADFELKQLAIEVNGLLRQEKQLRLGLFLAKDKVNSAQGDFDQVLQRGFRTLRELIILRQRWAGQITEQRYGDMAYRIFQNDALQKYRRQFDLTQQYAFLAAAAYDYETNLALGDPATGNHFMRQIVGIRSLGELRQRLDFTVVPVVGTGLSDPLARMADNFSVLKGQIGINNPQLETNRFSLRHELLRLRDESDVQWRETLLRYYTPDIYSIDDVARLAKRPFGEEGPQPGLVIPFSTNIIEGLNFFGNPLGPTDSAFDASQFATKIAGVGIWFENYDIDRLSQTPRVYLLPAGKDVIRPRDSTGRLRYWDIVEQLVPLPYAIGPADVQSAQWSPRNDGLVGAMYATKSHARFRAYPYTDDFDPSEMVKDTRLVGRSVWNTEWLLVIPGSALLADKQLGLERFIADVTDIHVNFDTYAYAGTRAAERAAAGEGE